jgi:hypothetical protein
MPYRRDVDEEWEEDFNSDGENEHDDEEELGGVNDQETTIPCPYCNRDIHKESVRCPYCERYLSEEDAPPSRRLWWLIAGVVAGLFAVYWWIIRR